MASRALCRTVSSAQKHFNSKAIRRTAIRSFATEKYDRSKPHVNIGTIGHVDHGKTTL